jgi:hypothetical protein
VHHSKKHAEMSSVQGGVERAASAPALRRWRSGTAEKRAPDDVDHGSMMTALSLEMDLERVENAPRKMFTPGIVPADLTLMEEEELKKERSKVREQIEATTVAIIAHKKDQQDLEKFIQVADAKREAAIKEFNEERQAYMMDLTGCLDKLQALRLEKSSIEERLEYVKYEMKRRILQEQAMETSSVCSAAGTERRIADRAVDDRPQRKDPAGDVPRPGAAGPGEVTVKARPPGPPAAAPDVGGSPAAAAAPILGGGPAAVAAPVLGGGAAAAAVEVIGGGYPRPPPPPQAGPRVPATGDVGRVPWDNGRCQQRRPGVHPRRGEL